MLNNPAMHYQQYSNWILNCCTQVIYSYQVNERRRRAAALAVLLHLKKKRKYSRKKYSVAQIVKERRNNEDNHAVLPKIALEDLRFHNCIRMSATQLENLLLLIGSDIFKQHFVEEPIDIAEHLLLTLKYLASGESKSTMSYKFLVGTTVDNIISEICEALWNNLLPLVLTMKLNNENWQQISECFFSKWNFPNCIGAIDGKRVNIECLPKTDSSLYNNKHSDSIVFLAICDANYSFLFVDIGVYNGSNGEIFKRSQIGQKFEEGEMKIPPPTACESGYTLPYCMVGDEAFPLKSYLMRPYPEKKHIDHDKQVFNYRLGRARRTVENTFGILANKWQIFRKPIDMSIDNSIKIVQATVCLHNWLRAADINEEENVQYITPTLIDQEDVNNFIPGSWRTESQNYTALMDITRSGNNSSTREAIVIREKFLHYFNNDGAVNWQDKYILQE